MLKTTKFFAGMALRCLAVLLSFLMAGGVMASAQQKNISLKVSNVSIESALNTVKSQYGISIVTQIEGLDLSSKVSVDFKNASVTEALKEIFKPQQIDVKIDGNVAMISAAAAKHFTVKGVVTDSAGEPVPGAMILVMGTKEGVTTDIDGAYTLTLTKPATLKCTCLGFVDQETKVGKESNVNFTMTTSSEFLEEVVVVGYGSLRRSLVSSAISKMSVDDNKLRNVDSPAALLSGRIAGVSVSGGSGNLGSGERMVIRGISSLSAGNEPLYVIDGVPITNQNANLTNLGEDMSSLAVLNISDIESIDVLKDAASAAIYGSRASNGVILITTKSGAAGKTTARINVSTSVSQFPNIHKIKMADSKLYVDAYNEGVDNYNKQYGLSVGDGKYKVHIFNPFGTLPDMDWMKVITRLGVSYNADASFSGGNKTTNFYIGANYNHKEGVIKTNRLDKFNLKAKIQHDFTKWLEVGANMSANYMKTYQVPGANAGTTVIGRSLEQRPYDRIYKPDGSYYIGGTDGLTFHNPIQVLNEQNAYIENMRFLGNAHINLKFLDNRISFKNTINTDITQLYDYTFYNSKHPYGKGVGEIIDRHETVMNLSFDSVLNYNDTYLDGDLNFNAMLGHSFQKVSTRTITLDGKGFPSDSFDVVGVASEVIGYGGNAYAYALESYFGRLNFGYKDRYTLTATLRTDGSSKFRPKYRWGWFPSVSFGWNMGKESWMKDSGVDMKLRVSYGKTGNQNGIGLFSSQSQMAGGKNYMGHSGIYSTVFGNPKLTWEKSGQTDVGVDLGFFNDKLTLIIDGYVKNTTDLLYSKPTFATSGTTAIMSNVGSIRNKGVEVTIGGNLDLGPVHWTSSFNIAHNKNTVTSITGNDDLIAIGNNRVLKVGEEVGTYYLFKFDGVYQYDAEVPEALYAEGVRAGDFRYANLDGDAKNLINDTDRAVKYSSNPKFSGGWSNTFYWKGLSLDVFLSYSYGSKIYFGEGSSLTRCGTGMGVMEKVALNRWTGPGSTNVYARAITGSSWNVKNSDYFLYDGSFIRLRSLTLSYNFGKKVLAKIHMKGLRVFAQGDNLFLLTRYPGYDPEVSSNLDARYFGVDALNVPQPRTVTFGLNLTF